MRFVCCNYYFLVLQGGGYLSVPKLFSFNFPLEVCYYPSLFAQVEGKHDEACIAMLNNFYADGAVSFIIFVIVIDIIKGLVKFITTQLDIDRLIFEHVGQVWHDIACYHKKWFVCEDSDKLMDFAKQTSPEHAPRI